MGIVFDLERKTHGGRRFSSKSDIYVSHVGDDTKGGQARAISVRVSKQTMERLRWIVGDHIKARVEIDESGSTARWTLRRVAGPDAGGCKLSGQGKGDGCGTARFTMPGDVIDAIFPGGNKGFDGALDKFDGGDALFVVEMAR